MAHGAGCWPVRSARSAYAVFCTEDCPLFVAVWYVAAPMIATIAGALLGHMILRS
jgi:hypothetical protein